jgi:hypothetical protein
MQFLNHIPTGTSPDFKDAQGNQVVQTLKIARMGSIPHGNTVLALGFVSPDASIDDQDDNAFPERLKIGDIVPGDFANGAEHASYLAPYKHFIDNPFKGCVDHEGFPGFSPEHFHQILTLARRSLDIKTITTLQFDTKFQGGFDLNEKPISDIPISNIPFLKREAGVTEMHATFWIIELNSRDGCAPPEFVMQYSQTVYLEFFNSPILGEMGRIRWPHVSINTLRKVDPQ